jgi:hypothetical protein
MTEVAFASWHYCSRLQLEVLLVYLGCILVKFSFQDEDVLLLLLLLYTSSICVMVIIQGTMVLVGA